jgi:cytochrome b subunit of formate dehydrogenase
VFPHRTDIGRASCRTCHARLTSAVSSVHAHSLQSRADLVSGPASRAVKKVYVALIGLMIFGLALFISARFIGGKKRFSVPDKSPFISDEERFIRMSLGLRLRHLALAASVILLLATGIPALLSEKTSLERLIGLGGASSVRIAVHLLASALFILAFFWRLAAAAFSPSERARVGELIPRLRDVLKPADSSPAGDDHLASPLAGRYGPVEKFEYWGAAWGGAVMIVTGFFLWRPELSLRLFPAWVLETFIAVHRWESVLILAWILLGHSYFVHFKPGAFPMNRAWLDGQITGRALRVLHPLEYRKIHEQRSERERVQNPYDNAKG